jgi:diaminohydroxyphosphoribosylaminopyrimidine deaminase / 5-amino-6-(5-phosphoribosylamino)uracil reductase
MRPGPNPHPAGSAAHFMYEALRLAHRGLGWTSPNPAVGCVIVRDGAIIGRGWHSRCGAEHAEFAALRDAGDARGATAYSTLEPCSHVGQQPACTTELQSAGVARVVFGIDDADPRSASRARSIFAAAGIKVVAGVLRNECAELLLPYLFAKREQRAHIHLKLALSLDSKLACANGASQWLSGPQSLGLAHYLRQHYDAVMVGRGTVLADDPRLTVRADSLREYLDLDGMTLRDPVRVIVDPQLRLLPQLAELNISRAGNMRTSLPQLIFVASKEAAANSSFAATSLPLTSHILGVDTLASGALDLNAAIAELYALGITSVLVEGGARLAQELTAQQAVDYATLVYTPLLLGGDALGFTPPLGLTSVDDARRVKVERVTQLGEDVAVSVSLR